MSEPISYVFTWHTFHDAKVCKKCLALSERKWYGQDLFQDILWDPVYGEVWDLNIDRSLVHPNCRCNLEVEVTTDLNKIPEIAEMVAISKATYNQINPTTLIGHTAFDGGRQMAFGYGGGLVDARRYVQGLKTDIDMALPSLREMNRLFRTYLSLAHRMGLPPEILQIPTMAYQAIAAIKMLTRSVQMMYLELGPVGWALAIGGLAVSSLMVVDVSMAAGDFMMEQG